MNGVPDFYIQFNFFLNLVCLFQNPRYQGAVPSNQKRDDESSPCSEHPDDQKNFVFMLFVV